MTYCKHCDKEVEPIRDGKRYRCPDCHLYVKATDDEKTEPLVEEIKEEIIEEPYGKSKSKKKEPEVVQEGPTKLVMVPKSVKYDAADLHMGEILINLGYAKDLNDLTRKNMKLAFSLMNMGAVGKQFNTMENQEPDPKRTMKEIQEQEMMKAYIDGMKGNSTDPMMTMMMMRMLDNQSKGKDAGDNGFMKELMQMQMMKMFSGGDNQQTSALQREIADLKQNMQVAQLISQQQQTQKGNQMSQDFMTKMEGIKSNTDMEMKRIEIEAQKQRDKNMQLVFDTKVGEIQTEMQRVTEDAKRKGQKPDLTSFKEQLTMVKELSTMLGDREKGTGENIMDGLGTIAEKVAPALIELGKRKQQAPPYQPPEPMTYPPGSNPPELPQELPPEQPNPQPNPHGLTPTEQQMADQNDEMYIHTDKKKKE